VLSGSDPQIEQIPLQAGIKDRLERLSTLMGVPPLALASHATQSWVAEQERTLALIESLGDRRWGHGSPLRIDVAEEQCQGERRS
jgi:hypothetical protein